MAQTADLAVTKSVSDPAPNVGDIVTFTVTASNIGPDNGTSVAVTDLLPVGLTFVNATPSQGTYDNATGLWTVGTITTVLPQTLTIAATLVSSNTQTNTATFSFADQFDPITANNSASATVTPQQADLAIRKSVDNPTPNVGDTIIFVVTVTDNGPDVATNVVVTDLLPAGLAFVSAAPSQGAYDPVTGQWTIGTITAAVPQTLTMHAQVVSAAPPTNIATIAHSDQFDPDTENNTASAAQQVDLAVTKSVGNATPNVGDIVAFTVTVTNNDAASATNVIVTDLLPVGLTFVSATPSQGSYDSVTGLWAIGTITTGVAQTLTVQAQVVSAAAQTNTATIAGADQIDPNTANNTASVTETPQQADLAVAKTVSNAIPNVGDTVTFTVTLSNSGAGAATNVTVTDLLPAGLAFILATPSQGTYVSGTGVWTIGTITTAVPQTLVLQARVVSAAAQTNTAAITHSDQFDPNTANNSASATETPQQADLAITKTVDNATPIAGSTITFTVAVSDIGPDNATNVTVADLLPAGLTFVSANPSQGSYDSLTGVWTIGTITAGSAKTLAVQAQVASPATQSNTASINHSDQFDPVTSNNSASATVTPAASASSDLAVAKSVDKPTPNVGDAVTFTVTVTNNGPAGATNVTLTDLLPAGLAFVSATPSQGTYVPATGVWTIGSVANLGSATLALAATVVSPAAQTNTAAITQADQSDPNSANNSASATVTPQQADLGVTKAVSNATPGVGSVITFAVTVSNSGPSDATNVTLADLLPAGLAFVSATVSQGAYASATGVWTAGTIANAGSATLSLVATVTQSGALTNTATITHADQFDPSSANNTASAAIAPPTVAPTITSLPIDLRWMFGLMALLVLATLPFLRRR